MVVRKYVNTREPLGVARWCIYNYYG